SLQQAIALQIQANNAMLSLLQGGALAPQAAAAPPVPPATAPAAATPAAPISSAQSAGSAQPAAGETSAAHGPFRPMQKNVSGELTDTQRRYLAEFMQAYQARTARSRDYASQ